MQNWLHVWRGAQVAQVSFFCIRKHRQEENNGKRGERWQESLKEPLAAALKPSTAGTELLPLTRCCAPVLGRKAGGHVPVPQGESTATGGHRRPQFLLL